MGVHRKVNAVKYGDREGFLLNSSQGEFEQMCLQEILGLTDKADVQQLLHDDFKDLKNVWMMERIQQGCHGNRSPPSALKQTTDYWKAKKYNTETREDAAT